ncbi:putative transposition, RNA-mediated [Lyophyllum shimeji]|uniref:Transposition, RNA-mediated n=1 Tax=Lyophyllum shimeji TaxID=47721 RepID=A0A9P3PYH9_LYOSH|nr:putative transposition, RNA-mediated [Lyophyllum shimeji]
MANPPCLPYIASDTMREHGLTTRTLSWPIPINSIDSTANAAGTITKVVDLVLRYNSHSEHVVFVVTDLGEQDMILGYTWLKEHNLEIDWATDTVSMSHYPSRCRTCQEEVKAERKARAKTRAAICACRASGIPAPEPELDDSPELCPDSDSENDYAPEMSPEPDSAPSSDSADAMEEEDVFSKAAFDELLECKQWDHAIELEPGSTPSSCKVYLLTPNEQAELDAFLEENLKSGRIRPSKSPMASLVFFIKKKDGSIRLVQDYRALNAIMVKNRYSLPLISELINNLRGTRYLTKLDVHWGYNNQCSKLRG